MTTRHLLVAGLAALSLALPVSAATGINASEAEKFFQMNCTRKQLSIIAFVCDLRERTDALRTRPAVLKIFDAAGTELGPLVRHDPVLEQVDEFYYPPLQRMVTVSIEPSEGQGRIVGRVLARYGTDDCTGQVYVSVPPTDLTRHVNSVLTLGPGKYYVLDRDSQPAEITVRSYGVYEGPESQFCTPVDPEKMQVRALRKVEIGFADPVAMPLRYAFE